MYMGHQGQEGGRGRGTPVAEGTESQVQNQYAYINMVTIFIDVYVCFNIHIGHPVQEGGRGWGAAIAARA